MSPAAANREVYSLLKDDVIVQRARRHGQRARRDHPRHRLEHPRQQRLLPRLAALGRGRHVQPPRRSRRLRQRHPPRLRRTQGHPRRLEHAYQDNLRDYKDTIPQLFWYNALIILSNGSQTRVGSLTAGWEHFFEWKKIDSEGEPGVISLETVIRGVCDHARLLDLVENFILFRESGGALIKILAKNHQYLGVNNALEAVHADPRAPGPPRRLLAHPGQRQEPLDGLLLPEGPAQAARQLDLPHRHRPPGAGRPDLQELRRHRRRHRARARVHADQRRRTCKQLLTERPPLSLHPDPEVPHRARRALSRDLRPLRHHRHHR